ncbi:MAG: chemotaxis-specific protein-glutamate methyltransferase CheB [Nitrospirae bacterium]|nr:chemotaxis-specific protein-glutamate methyltransferase CheB [Nitrospirota bacterium]
MVNVLIVEDSPVAAQLLCHVLSSDPDIRVLAVAKNGKEALTILERQRPDVITMDINMPGIDGYETARQIMKTRPVPIVIVSSVYNPQEISASFKAVEAGALAILEKPPGPRHPDYQKKTRELVTTVKLMSEVKVVKRYGSVVQYSADIKDTTKTVQSTTASDIKVIAIGTSTGGPVILQSILSQLPKEFQIPILIVQHISKGFTEGFVNWLSKSTRYPVRIATHGESIKPAQAYVAPDDIHMGINSSGSIMLSNESPHGTIRPSVSYLFRAVAASFRCQAIGVLLTGMGKDGAAELKLIRDSGGITIAQDKESSTVYGMPAEAARIGAATYILSPEDIVQFLIGTAKREINSTQER